MDQATQPDAIEDRIEAALAPEETVAEETEEAVEGSKDTLESESDETEAQVENDDEGVSVAELLGVPEERIIYGEDGSIRVETKVNGKTDIVDPKKFVENYQREQAANAKSMEATERLKQADTMAEQVKAEYAGRLEQAEIVIAIAGKQLEEKYGSIDWPTLEANDPGQAALLRQKIQEEANGVRQHQQQLMQARQQHNEQQSQRQQQAEAEFLQQQLSVIIEKNPRLNDEAVRGQEFGEMKSYLSSAGATDEEIAGFRSSLQYEMVSKAMAYDKAKTQAQPKIAKAVPKFQKPGQRSGQQPAQKAAQQKRARLRKSGSGADLASVLEDLL
jgi:hypothetical protein